MTRQRPVILLLAYGEGPFGVRVTYNTAEESPEKGFRWKIVAS